VTNIIIKLLHVATKTQHRRRQDGQLHCRSGNVQCNGTTGTAQKHNIFVPLVGVLCNCASGDNRTVDGVTSERRNATAFGLETEFDILND